MTDFLTRLVEKERGKTTTIEPRLPAVYDPSRAGAAVGEVRATSVEPAISEVEDTTEAPRPPDRDEAGEPKGDAHSGRLPAGESVASPRPFSVSPPPGNRQGGAEEPGPRTVATRIHEDVHPPVDALPSRRLGREPSAQTHTGPPRSTGQHMAADETEREAGPPGSLSIAPILPREPGTARPVQPATGRSQSPAVRRERESGPDVRVSIGRVEVRANLVPTAPPVRKTREKRGSSQSLEDYLRSKVGRNR